MRRAGITDEIRAIAKGLSAAGYSDEEVGKIMGEIVQTLAGSNIHILVIADSSHVSWVDAPKEFPELLAKALRNTIRCR
jgi:hypothetical protein